MGRRRSCSGALFNATVSRMDGGYAIEAIGINTANVLEGFEAA